MMIFLSLCLVASALCLGLAHATEASGIRQGVQGATGFILTMVTLASLGASVVATLIVWIVADFWTALAVGAASALWHSLFFFLSVRRLTELAGPARRKGTA